MSNRTSSKKVLQSFHARDKLWEAFSAHAQTMDCSVDYLINEAMRNYATTHDFMDAKTEDVEPDVEEVDDLLDDIDDIDEVEEIEEVDDVEEMDDIEELDGLVESSDDLPSLDGDDASLDNLPPIEDDGDDLPSLDDDDDLPSLDDDDGETDEISDDSDDDLPVFDDDDDLPSLDDDDDMDGLLLDEDKPKPPKPADTGAPTIAQNKSVPKAPAAKRPSAPSPPKPPRAVRTPGVMRDSSTGRVPVAPGSGSVSHTEPSRPVLTMIYEGRKIIVQKDQFILGRGSKSADMAIKDANVSRKHAAIIFHNGAYYIKDLGSTNGVEFGNQLVDSKRIDEGDVFAICGHKFHFTYS